MNEHVMKNCKILSIHQITRGVEFKYQWNWSISKDSTSILFLDTLMLSLTKLLVILTGGGTHLVRLHQIIQWLREYLLCSMVILLTIKNCIIGCIIIKCVSNMNLISTHPLTFSKNSGGRSRRTRLMKIPYRSSAGPSVKPKKHNRWEQFTHIMTFNYAD